MKKREIKEYEDFWAHWHETWDGLQSRNGLHRMHSHGSYPTETYVCKCEQEFIGSEAEVIPFFKKHVKDAARVIDCRTFTWGEARQ